MRATLWVASRPVACSMRRIVSSVAGPGRPARHVGAHWCAACQRLATVARARPARPGRRPAADRVPARAGARADVSGEGLPHRGGVARRRSAPTTSPQRVEAGTLQKLTGIGKSTARCIAESLHGEEPALPAPAGRDRGRRRSTRPRRPCGRRCAATATRTRTGPTAARRSARWRETARALGHEYFVLTDHSPRLTVANGLTAERLERQLDVVAELNDEFAAQAAAGTARRSASSPASRSTSSTTARWTRSRRCWPASTSSSPASTRSCGCRPRR